VASRSRGRFWLFVGPLSAVLVVLLGVVSGGVRPIRSARVYSGPTQGVTELSLRVEVGERDRVMELPVPGAAFSVEVVEGGQSVGSARGRTDALGNAEVRVGLRRPRDSALELRVVALDHLATPLARGLVLGRLDVFRATATRRGGFQRGRHTGDIELSVAPAHGVLITAQGALKDQLVIRALQAGAPVANASVSVKLEGAEPAESRVRTDAQGLARLELQPREATVRVELQARADASAEGTLASRLDVVQGAIRVTREGDELRLVTSGAANLAYLAFFDENQRYLGLHVALSPAADGRLTGVVPWPAGLPSTPLWVVASSQPDLASPSAVGWPVAGADQPDPRTFDARELLLLDGAPVAQLREERRARRIRWVTAGYSALALAVTLLLFVRRVTETDRTFAQHLTQVGVDDPALNIAPAGKGRALLAAACIALGFVILALFALLKE
jgi:hypothetical protein